MIRTEHFKMFTQVFKDVLPVLTSGILTVVLLSCMLFGIQTYFNFNPGLLSIGATVFQSGHLHRLLLYPLYHRTFSQLLLNASTLVLLGGSLEKGFGTVRFLFLFVLLSSTTGFFYSFVDLLQSDSDRNHTEGLLPVALACVAVTTMHTRTTKGFLCGVTFPTMALPWVFLVVTTALVPGSVLPCNVIAVLVGWTCGKGWLSVLSLSEARAGVVEKMMPFTLLRRIRGVSFVPASTEERRKTLLPRINPTPGTYPVQAYAPLSTAHAHTAANSYEGWPNATSLLSGPVPPLHSHGNAFVPSHGHSLEQSFGHNHSHSHGHNHSHGHGHSCNHNHGHSH